MTRWRQRMGEEKLTVPLQDKLRPATRRGAACDGRTRPQEQLEVNTRQNSRSLDHRRKLARWWKASRIAVASASVTENMAERMDMHGGQRNAAQPSPRTRHRLRNPRGAPRTARRQKSCDLRITVMRSVARAAVSRATARFRRISLLARHRRPTACVSRSSISASVRSARRHTAWNAKLRWLTYHRKQATSRRRSTLAVTRAW